jgi:acylphosphatase
MSTQPPVALHAIIRGRVQGVGFREFVQRRALSQGLTGYVRNLSDGRSVEVVAEGRRDLLERLVERLSEGPRAANVLSMDADWGPATGLYGDFDARL